MAQEELKKALALMKSGRKKEATLVLQTILRQDRNNAQAWWLMANALEDDDKKRKAAEKVLALDATHKGAQRLIASLLLTTDSVSSTPTPPPLTTQEINIDFGKLDELEAKVKPADESADSKVIKMATYLIGAFVVVVILAVIFLSLIPNYQDSQKEKVIIASMDGFLSAIVEGDFVVAEGYVCEQYHMDQERTSNFARGLRPLYPDAQVDFTELEITVDDLKADTATAMLSGQISITPTDAETQIVLIEDLMGESGFGYGVSSFSVILENEQWRVCDGSFASE